MTTSTLQTTTTSEATLIARVTEKATGRKWDVYAVESDKGDGTTYQLWIEQRTGCAVDCSCPHRAKKLRKAGRACKHMMRWNAARTASRRAALTLVAVASTVAQAQAAELPSVEQTLADARARREALLNLRRAS